MIIFLKFKLGYISLLNKTFLFLSPIIYTQKDLTTYFSRLSSQLLSSLPPLTSIISSGRLSINKPSGIILSVSGTAISFNAFLYIFRKYIPSAWNGFLPHLCPRNHSILLAHGYSEHICRF